MAASSPPLSYLPLNFLLWLALLYPSLVRSDIASDAAALLDFKSNVTRGVARILSSWNNVSSICISWEGVACIGNGSSQRVLTLRLPGKSLYGPIPYGTLGRLSALDTLSLRSNKLSGSLPVDLANCISLRRLFLQKNLFSGPLLFNFSALPQLALLDLSYNNFSGPIPPSLNFTRLKWLFLQNNSFTGTIPSFDIPTLTNFSVANNLLNGSVPPGLSGFPASCFSGNSLCGYASVQCPSHLSKGCVLSAGAIVGIVLGGLSLVTAVVLIYLCFHRNRSRGKKQRDKGPDEGGQGQAGAVAVAGDVPRREQASAVSTAAERESQNKLIFIDRSKQTFDLDDLLRASAEVLGRGSLGTVYKAVLEDGSALAVKRLRDIVNDGDNYQHRIDMIGHLKHQNLVPLRAYYLVSEEKLLVFDYMHNGSLSALLHGTRGAGRTPLDWDTRVRIALSSARGIAYLHSHKFVHGNIKSSNVLLTPAFDGCLTDYGLVQLVSSVPSANKAVGYVPPETTDPRRVTEKGDVYSFGVLLLELLTGKPPTQAAMNDDGVDLPRWVQSVVREEWTAEVFDMELMKYQDIEEEMVKLLQIAMPCVATSPDQRPTMPEIVKMIENLKMNDDASDFYFGHYPASTSAVDAH